MSYRGRRYSGWFGAFILIAVGVIGLLDNFDIVPREVLHQLWKLWPLIPLAIGVNILFRPRYWDRHSEDTTIQR